MLKPQFAILLDGGFLTKKLYARHRRHATAEDVIAECDRISGIPQLSDYELLRIYYYDALPAESRLRNPADGSEVELSRTERYARARSLYDTLELMPNVALRMGSTAVRGWRLKRDIGRQLVRAPRELTAADFELDIEQKGVDLRIGLDMARLALGRMVRVLVVVTGDSDLVPAFKFVRREGVKLFLHAMGHGVRRELKAHADLVLELPAESPIAAQPLRAAETAPA